MLRITAITVIFGIWIQFCSASAKVFDAHRLLQFQKEKPGSATKTTSLNLGAAVLHVGNFLTSHADLARKVAILDLHSYADAPGLGLQSEALINSVTEAITTRQAAALLVVMPVELHKYRPRDLLVWREMEASLMSFPELTVPVFFAFENPSIRKLIDQLHASGFMDPSPFALTDRYQLNFQLEAPLQLPVFPVSNIQGLLSGQPLPGSDAQLPTIAIVSYYDSLGGAVDLSSGFNTNGSGVVSLLALARIFSRLYAMKETTAAPYNVIFLLTGAGMVNFSGTKDWLVKADPALVESLSFVLCLDSLAGHGIEENRKVYLHSPKQAKEGITKDVFDAFLAAAKKLQVPLEISHKKANISGTEIQWQHEQFLLKRVFSATLSSVDHTDEKPTPFGSIFDPIDSHGKKMSALTRNTKLVALALSSLIYGEQNPLDQVFQGDTMISKELFKEWSSKFASIPRPTFSIGKNTTYLDTLQETLGGFTEEIGRFSHTLAPPFAVHVDSKATFAVLLVKPVSFDLLLSAAIFAYLFILYVCIKGPSNIEITNPFGSKKEL